MPRFLFLVQGSETEPYKVEFDHDGTNYAVFCNCKAGENGLHCKHRMRILEGEITSIVSENTQDVSKVINLFNQSELVKLIHDLRANEHKLEALEWEIRTQKKRIALLMAG